MSFNSLPRIIAEQFGPWPLNYAVIDIETSGVDPSTDLILNLGHVIVEDGVVTDRMDVLLDWTRVVDPRWLEERMDYARRSMAEKGRDYKMSIEDLRTRGEDPVSVLAQYRDLMLDQQAAGYSFVMHNGYNFDAPRIVEHFRRWLNSPFDFGDHSIWDTGMVEKAMQINSVPDRNDTMKSWCRRVGNARIKGVSWSLENYCVKRYDLVSRFELNPDEAHGAGYDAYVTHLVFEEQRWLSSQTEGDPVPVSEDPRDDYIPPVPPPGPGRLSGRRRRIAADDTRYDHLGV